MRIFRKSLESAFLMLAVIVSGCGGADNSQKTNPQVTIEPSPNEFKNDFFNLTITKPADWYATSIAQQESLLNAGTEVFVSDNKDMKRLVEPSLKKTVTLFNFFMYELGSPVAVNPAVMGLAENVSLLPGVKSGKDYFFHAKKMMNQSGINYTFAEGYKQRMIGGVAFDEMDLTISLNGVEVQQSYYAARHGDYVITIIESYGVPEYKEATSDVIDAIKFDWRGD